MVHLTRIIFYMFCVTGLTYQLSSLIEQYTSGQTVVNLSIGRRHNDTIPAITICYPFALLMDMMAKLNKDIGSLYDKYLTLIEKMRNDFSTSNVEKLNDITKNLEEYTRTNIDKVKTDRILEDYTPKDYLIFLSMKKGHKTLNRGDLNLSAINTLIINGHRDSYDITQSRFYKCFTHFSALHSRWRYETDYFNEIILKVSHDYKWNPYTIFQPIYFSIHSPNTFLNFDGEGNYLELNLGSIYNLEYTSLKINHIEGFSSQMESYNNYCYNYALDSNVSFSYDCLTECLRETLNQTDCIGPRDNPLRHNILLNMHVDFMRICPQSSKFDQNNVGVCWKTCKINCQFIHYSIDIKKQWTEKGEHYFQRSVTISLKHSRLPDVLVRHLPEITFISFISNFGGLLGLWLGFSVFSILTDLSIHIKNIISNRNNLQIINFNILYKRNR